MLKLNKILIATMAFNLALVALTVGCGKDTTGDVVVRERDRDRERAATIAKDYDEVAGYFIGQTTDARIGLLIETSRVSEDGKSVPQPSLIGSLSFAPNILVGKTGQRVKIAFPFHDGVYDKASGDLSFTIDKDGNPSPVKCHLGGSGVDTLKCTWYSRLFNKEFSVVRDDKDKALALAQETALTETYVGQAMGTSVSASFEAALDQEEGNQLMQLTIVGKFTFATQPSLRLSLMASGEADSSVEVPAATTMIAPPSTEVPFLFYNGSYDVATGTLSMSIEAEPQKILVNCLIESESRLRCKWYAREYAEFVLTKE